MQPMFLRRFSLRASKIFGIFFLDGNPPKNIVWYSYYLAALILWANSTCHWNASFSHGTFPCSLSCPLQISVVRWPCACHVCKKRSAFELYSHSWIWSSGDIIITTWPMLFWIIFLVWPPWHPLNNTRNVITWISSCNRGVIIIMRIGWLIQVTVLNPLYPRGFYFADEFS